MAPIVPEFYSGKSVLVTGATGFLGKVLLEKLLRSCPDIKAIYLLMRPKRGASSQDRLKELCDKKLFQKLRENQPGCFEKLKVISGDVTEDGLGISEEDREELQRNCNIVFHSAACVRFDQKLKVAVNMNVIGTLRVLTLAETFQNLLVFIHLSTAFSRCELDSLEEKVYPPVHPPRSIIDMVSWMDDATLDHLEQRLISPEPNTYSYTKSIAESLVGEYSGKIPIAIVRPSIVLPSYKEPMPGWVDNINGPTGIVMGAGKGVIRCMLMEASYSVDAIPVDKVVNACIIIAYLTAIEKPKDIEVYNVTLSKAFEITWGEVLEKGEKLVNDYPYSVALWYPGGGFKSNRFSFNISVFLYHTIPAYIVDALLFLFRRETFMVKIQNRISHGLSVLEYYTGKEWHFRNDKYRALKDRISREDDVIFYTDPAEGEPDLYLRDFVLGIREFICKEDMSTLPRARKYHFIRYIVDRAFKAAFFLLLAWLLYSNLGLFSSTLHYVDNTMKNIAPRHLDL